MALRKVLDTRYLNRALKSQCVNNTFSRCCSAKTGQQKFEDIEIPLTDEHAPKWVQYEYEEVGNESLYDGHYPTTLFQKSLLAVGSSLTAITNVYRADMIACFGEVTGSCAFSYMREQMLQTSEGQQILAEQPRINTKTVDYDKLMSLPPNTFGYTYAKFMKDNNISSDSRDPVHFVDDVQLAYVAQRYREVHDLFHTLLDMPTNMLGEVCVKWVEATQTRLPMCVSGAIFGPLRFTAKQREKYINTYLPWTMKAAFETKPFMGIYFEKRWEQDMVDLRNELRVPPFLGKR